MHPRRSFVFAAHDGSLLGNFILTICFVLSTQTNKRKHTQARTHTQTHTQSNKTLQYTTKQSKTRQDKTRHNTRQHNARTHTHISAQTTDEQVACRTNNDHTQTHITNHSWTPALLIQFASFGSGSGLHISSLCLSTRFLPPSQDSN